MDLGKRDMGAQLPRVERDRLFQVGDGQIELAALETDQAAIGQEGIAKFARLDRARALRENRPRRRR